MAEHEAEIRAITQPLQISAESRETGAGTFALIRAEGEIDLANADELGGALRAAAADQGSAVILDLRGVPFMDSTGLKVILIASRDLDGPLAVIAGAGSAVARLLDLAGVADRVPRFETEEEALDALGSAGAERPV
jgi:stage II sporulation protein AA (anti-sigma F factor antagonist)